jgi:hypothetical protein
LGKKGGTMDISKDTDSDAEGQKLSQTVIVNRVSKLKEWAIFRGEIAV